MRIIYLHQYFNTPEMAGGTRSYEMARRFVEKGHTVDMVTSYREETDKNSWFETVEAGINVHWLPVRYSNHLSFTDRINAFFKFAVKASIKAASLDGDVIFATSTPLTIALPAAYAKRKLKVPLVFEVRDLWPELPIAIGALKRKPVIAAAKWLEKFAYRKSDHIVALSPDMKEGITKAGYPEVNVSVIPNSCDMDLFDISDEESKAFRFSQSWLKERPLVVYTGTLGHINGVGYLVQVAKRMKSINPDVKFLIVGDGVEKEKIQQLALDTGTFEKNLFMYPQMPKRDISRIINAADVATSLFINLKEMWSNSANKFFDALAAGKPVLINYEGWQAALLKEYDAGIVVPPDDPQQAAIELARLLEDRDRLNRLSKSSKLLGTEKFNRDLLASRLLRILEETATS